MASCGACRSARLVQRGYSFSADCRRLHMNKRSALGTFVIRTALRNGLDFHPMSVHSYIQDASLDGLLLRLPDALFDPAWLNTEDYQRDRPPQPYFTA